MSTDTNKTKAALQSIMNFIRAEPSYVNITNQYGISLAPTMTASQQTIAVSNTLGADLSSVFQTWNQLKPDQTDSTAEAIIRSMFVSIDAASEELASLKSASSNLNVAANGAISGLNALLKNLNTDIANQNNQITRYNNLIAANNVEINSINKKLSGSSGFLQGFLTGITLGIYSGLRDDLSTQKNDRTKNTNNRVLIQQAQAQTRHDINVINQINPALRNVETLDASIVSLENTMQTLEALVQKTEHDGERLVGTENGKVAEFYRHRFNKDMTALLQWQGVFS